jgi:hypothetical protein
VAEAEGACGHARRVVQPEDRVTREALEEAVGDHALRAAAGAGLLGRLEHEVHGAAEVARARELLRRAQQHRGVAVVPAGMHHAVVHALPGPPRRFADRQRVHVGAQRHAARAAAHVQRAHHAVPAHAARDVPAPLLQPAGHELGRGRLLERELGVAVQVAPRLGQEAGRAVEVAELAQAPKSVVHAVLLVGLRTL